MSSSFTVKLSGGQRLRFYPSSISAALWVSGDARNDDAGFLELVLRPGDCYVDCGANVGHLAVTARSLTGSEGTVVAIEANRRIYEFCVGNLELNGFHDVLAVNVALGASRGSVKISERRDDDQNRIGGEGSEVPLRPLDDVVGLDRVWLLKIDVEGYELEVIRGAPRTLAVTDLVFCELSASNSARFGYAPDQVEDLLLAAGFVFLRRNGNRWTIVRGRMYEGLPPEAIPTTGYNLIAVKPSALETLRERLVARDQVVDG